MEARHGEARMFDEIIVGLNTLEAEIATINTKPLPLMDLKYAEAELKARPAKMRKRLGKTRTAKSNA
jgi:hypothetical protein